MWRVVPILLIGGLASTAAAIAATSIRPTTFEARWGGLTQPLDAVAVMRGGKRDRLSLPEPSRSVVRVRDESGRVLFHNDSAARMTIVTKGVFAPKSTAPAPKPVVREIGPEKAEKLPIACESAFSPVAAPALAHIPGRCMA